MRVQVTMRINGQPFGRILGAGSMTDTFALPADGRVLEAERLRGQS